MSLDDFKLTCLCWMDDALPAVAKVKKVRQVSRPAKKSDCGARC